MLSSYTLSKRTEMVVGFHSCFFVPVVPRFFCRSNVVSSDSFKLICELRSAELNRFFFLVFFFIGVLIKVLSFSLPFGILVLFSQISSSSSLFIAVIASQSSPLLKRTWLFILFSIYAGSVIAFGVPSVIVGIFDTFPKPKKKRKGSWMDNGIQREPADQTRWRFSKYVQWHGAFLFFQSTRRRSVCQGIVQ